MLLMYTMNKKYKMVRNRTIRKKKNLNIEKLVLEVRKLMK